jgi:hypothetical protein
MADFGALGEAMMRSMGRPPGEFLALYQNNRADSMLRVLDSSPVAAAVRTMVIERAGTIVRGTMKDAHAVLANYKPADADAPWPKSPKGLADALRRYQPALALVGIEVVFHGIGRDGSMVTIRPAPIPSGRPIDAGQVHQVHHVHAGGEERELGEHGERRPIFQPSEKGMSPGANNCGLVEIEL